MLLLFNVNLFYFCEEIELSQEYQLVGNIKSIENLQQ